MKIIKEIYRNEEGFKVEVDTILLGWFFKNQSRAIEGLEDSLMTISDTYYGLTAIVSGETIEIVDDESIYFLEDIAIVKELSLSSKEAIEEYVVDMMKAVIDEWFEEEPEIIDDYEFDEEEEFCEECGCFFDDSGECDCDIDEDCCCSGCFFDDEYEDEYEYEDEFDEEDQDDSEKVDELMFIGEVLGHIFGLEFVGLEIETAEEEPEETECEHEIEIHEDEEDDEGFSFDEFFEIEPMDEAPINGLTPADKESNIIHINELMKAKEDQLIRVVIKDFYYDTQVEIQMLESDFSIEEFPGFELLDIIEMEEEDLYIIRAVIDNVDI